MLMRNISKSESMKPELILALVQDIRDELGLDRGVSPIIGQVFAHPDGSLHIVTSDRSEKSFLLGPGGRVAAELAKRVMQPVTIYGADEILLKKHRLELTLRRIEELTSSTGVEAHWSVLQGLRKLITQELKFPEESCVFEKSIGHGERVAVAFSGGIDSSAALVILKECGFEPEAIVVDLQHVFLDQREMAEMVEWCSHLNVKLTRIPQDEATSEVVRRAREGKIHPCGECHALILACFLRYATESNHSVLVTGELLPAGRQAIVENGRLLTIHLPAALSLTKHRTEHISKTYGRSISRKQFGCRLVADTHANGWMNMGPSINRVLRELQAGILTTGQALEYIKTIVKSVPDMESDAEE